MRVIKMPAITKQIKAYTDVIFDELKNDSPIKLVKAFLKFGEFLGEQFPDKNNEEIQKELKKSGITFDPYVLAELALIKLGAMHGIATTYYSDRDDKCEEMLAKGDASLLHTYKAWKIAIVVFSYFVEESPNKDLFIGLTAKVKEKTNAWSEVVNSYVDRVVEKDSARKQIIIKLQNICQQYQELIIVEIKKAALELPRPQLALLKNENGKIDLEKVIKLPDFDVHKYPAFHAAKIRYLAIHTLNNSLNDQTATSFAKLTRFCSLTNNADIKNILTSNTAEKSLWSALINLVRAVRISGIAGFFHAHKTIQADKQLKEVISHLPKMGNL
jgi:hypothetical protein